MWAGVCAALLEEGLTELGLRGHDLERQPHQRAATWGLAETSAAACAGPVLPPAGASAFLLPDGERNGAVGRGISRATTTSLRLLREGQVISPPCATGTL